MTADGVGGVWQYATDLSTGLAGRGVEVLLAVMGPPLTEDQRADAAMRGVRVIEGPYRLEWMDDPWHDVEEAGRWLLELETSFSPDVVHLNGYCHATMPWRSPAFVVGHSCVRSWWRAVQGGPAPADWDRYSEAVARGLRAARLVITPTRAMLSALREEYGAFGEARVIANARAAPRPNAPVIARRSAAAEKSELVFAAGRLWDPAKNINALSDVAPLLAWPVCVAGDDGPAWSHPGPTVSVRRLGRLSADAIGEWYARASIYALPARYEPFGLSILEAALAGCALVLGDIPSLRENWDGAAEFVPPDDHRALTVAINDLIEDPKRRAVLAESAAARASRFSLARMVDDYTALYEMGTRTFTRSSGPIDWVKDALRTQPDVCRSSAAGISKRL
jgi:glycosyltransferase involved in cell wall biosynthesis